MTNPDLSENCTELKKIFSYQYLNLAEAENGNILDIIVIMSLHYLGTLHALWIMRQRQELRSGRNNCSLARCRTMSQL
ncbi:22155_t:CDS:2 [Cetraspora pellucida]|uniref:22155_t:CDS:1 n=1 Tax=Cetraspora pellucida TaxID=1433469 RepID=A0A9N9C1I1_9GLOM|nr:22155_t:CDS:2 [Cetraspora pellucida]